MSFFKKRTVPVKLKKLFAVTMCLCMCLCGVIPIASAVDGAAVTDIAPEEAASQVFGFMAEQLNFTVILSVLSVVIGAALAMVLGWWAIRKVGSALMKAFKSGKLKI